MVTHAPIDLRLLPCLGYVFTPSSSRNRLHLVNNETAAHVPTIFFDPEKIGPHNEPVQKLFDQTVQMGYKISKPVHEIKFLVQISAGIKDHCENRIQLIWQQFLMVFNTQLDFPSQQVGAQHQAGFEGKKESSIPIQYAAVNGEISLQEAHSSTLPCLLVKQQHGNCIFGAETSFYNAQNMTVRLPKTTNTLDTWIETSKQQPEKQSLRDVAIALIQKLSNASITPGRALEDFLKAFGQHVVEYERKHGAKANLSSRLYLAVIHSYQIKIAKDDLIKTLCFEKKSAQPVDQSFFLKVQVPLHTVLKEDLRIALLRAKIPPIILHSKTTLQYARIYLNDSELRELLSRYFKMTQEESLLEDWKNIVQLTPAKIQDFAKQKKISKELVLIATTTIEKIKTLHSKSTINNFGAIVANILYESSINLNPNVYEMYSRSDVFNRGPTTRATIKA